jgi:hypothetical protein
MPSECGRTVGHAGRKIKRSRLMSVIVIGENEGIDSLERRFTGKRPFL